MYQIKYVNKINNFKQSNILEAKITRNNIFFPENLFYKQGLRKKHGNKHASKYDNYRIHITSQYNCNNIVKYMLSKPRY